MNDKKSRRDLFEEELLRQNIATFINEVTIAGEVPTDTLYAKYRPDDAMQYIGMKPKTDADAGGGESATGEEGGEGSEAGSGGGVGSEHLDQKISFDETGDDVEPGSGGSSISSTSTSVHERLYYTMMHRNSKFNP